MADAFRQRPHQHETASTGASVGGWCLEEMEMYPPRINRTRPRCALATSLHHSSIDHKPPNPLPQTHISASGTWFATARYTSTFGTLRITTHTRRYGSVVSTTFIHHLHPTFPHPPSLIATIRSYRFIASKSCRTVSNHVELETVDTACAHECATTVMNACVSISTVPLGIAFVDMRSV